MGERGIQPMSRRTWNEIHAVSTPIPTEHIQELGNANSPAGKLRRRSIVGEYIVQKRDFGDPKNYAQLPESDGVFLLGRLRESRHFLEDLRGTVGNTESITRHTRREQLIQEELGLGQHAIIFEKFPYGTPGRVSTVLEQFEDEGEVDPNLLHKTNRERVRSSHSHKHRK